MINEFIKYFISSAIALCVDFSLLYLLTEFVRIYYLLSAAISFILGVITIYMLSVMWVFKERKIEDRKKEFIIFTIIGIIGLGINSMGMWFFTEKIHFHYLESKILTTAFVFMWNFTARKFILF